MAEKEKQTLQRRKQNWLGSVHPGTPEKLLFVH